MMFFEVFVPRGALSDLQRRRLGERLITEFMSADEENDAPEGVVNAARAIEQVVFCESDPWIVGGRAVDPAEPPRYVVRVSVPGAWRKEMSEAIITRVTRILAEGDDDPDRFYREPHAWVHVIGVPEGSGGAFGKVLGSNDLVRLITRPFRESADRAARAADLPSGTALDPVCGMVVSITDAAAVVEHEGTTYAFCAPGCHAVFAEEQRAAAT